MRWAAVAGSGHHALPTRQHERVPTVEVVGVYPVVAAEPCHLVELIVRENDEPFDVGAITQADPARPRSEWQVPYEEKLLKSGGDGVLHDPWRGPGQPSLWTGSVRLASSFTTSTPIGHC